VAKRAFEHFITASKRCIGSRGEASTSWTNDIALRYATSSPTKFTNKSSYVPIYVAGAASTFKAEKFRQYTFLDNGPLGDVCVASSKALSNMKSRSHLRIIFQVKDKVNRAK